MEPEFSAVVGAVLLLLWPLRVWMRACGMAAAADGYPFRAAAWAATGGLFGLGALGLADRPDRLGWMDPVVFALVALLTPYVPAVPQVDDTLVRIGAAAAYLALRNVRWTWTTPLASLLTSAWCAAALYHAGDLVRRRYG